MVMSRYCVMRSRPGSQRAGKSVEGLGWDRHVPDEDVQRKDTQRSVLRRNAEMPSMER